MTIKPKIAARVGAWIMLALIGLYIWSCFIPADLPGANGATWGLFILLFAALAGGAYMTIVIAYYSIKWAYETGYKLAENSQQRNHVGQWWVKR